MNKTDLIHAVADSTDLTKAQATAATNALLDAITDTLVSRGEVRIYGFGTFAAKHRGERKLNSPMAKGTVPAHHAPVFKASKSLKEAVK